MVVGDVNHWAVFVHFIAPEPFSSRAGFGASDAGRRDCVCV